MTPLGLPVDPEGGLVTVKVRELPGLGSVLQGTTGTALSVNQVITAQQLADLVYSTEKDAAGYAGVFRYIATDESGGSSDIREGSGPTTAFFADTAVLDVRHEETDGAQRFGHMPEIFKPILGFPESAVDQECAGKRTVPDGKPEIDEL